MLRSLAWIILTVCVSEFVFGQKTNELKQASRQGSIFLMRRAESGASVVVSEQEGLQTARLMGADLRELKRVGITTMAKGRLRFLTSADINETQLALGGLSYGIDEGPGGGRSRGGWIQMRSRLGEIQWDKALTRVSSFSGLAMNSAGEVAVFGKLVPVGASAMGYSLTGKLLWNLDLAKKGFGEVWESVAVGDGYCVLTYRIQKAQFESYLVKISRRGTIEWESVVESESPFIKFRKLNYLKTEKKIVCGGAYSDAAAVVAFSDKGKRQWHSTIDGVSRIDLAEIVVSPQRVLLVGSVWDRKRRKWGCLLGARDGVVEARLDQGGIGRIKTAMFVGSREDSQFLLGGSALSRGKLVPWESTISIRSSPDQEDSRDQGGSKP